MLLERSKTHVCIFNMQLEIIPLLRNGMQLLHDCRWLADVCRSLQIACCMIEHRKLGERAQTLSDVAGDALYFEKAYFDFLQEPDIAHYVATQNQEHFVLAGAETHVCLFQSALGLKKLGKTVFLLADTCSARSNTDHAYGLSRIQESGIHVITREMFFFEMIRTSEYPGYLDLAMKFLDGRYLQTFDTSLKKAS